MTDQSVYIAIVALAPNIDSVLFTFSDCADEFNWTTNGSNKKSDSLQLLTALFFRRGVCKKRNCQQVNKIYLNIRLGASFFFSQGKVTAVEINGWKFW